MVQPLDPVSQSASESDKERPRWPGMAITGAAVSGKGYAVQKCAEFLPRPGSEARCKKRRKRERVGCRKGSFDGEFTRNTKRREGKHNVRKKKPR